MSGSGNVNTLERPRETERAPPPAAAPRRPSEPPAMYFTLLYILIPSEKGTEARVMYGWLYAC